MAEGRQPNGASRSPWRSLKKRAALLLAPPLIFSALRLLQATLRIEIEGEDLVRQRWQSGEAVIFAFWHGRMLAMPLAGSITGARACVLISQHGDGEIATRVIRSFGIEVVRGSTSRGGAAGLVGLVRAHRRGVNPVVVLDGPRGPRCVAKPGVVKLARTTGAAIVPLSYSADRAWQLSSWDRMIVPKPFARVHIVAGSPMQVAATTPDDEIDGLRKALESDLDAATRQAQGLCENGRGL